MYGIPDSVKPLSAAEEQVMLAVWACRAPVTRRDIDAKLRAKGWAPATVLNFLYRLEEKGWVKSGKDGNRNTYTPVITQRAYNVWSMRERLDTLLEMIWPRRCARWSARAAAARASWNRP